MNSAQLHTLNVPSVLLILPEIDWALGAPGPLLVGQSTLGTAV